jgi:hypothetical protein
MLLGKITVKIENVGGHKNFYCRPVCAGDNLIHPQRIGICHVVFLEKSSLTNGLVRDSEFTCFGIFDRIHSTADWLHGFTKLKVSPITEEIYNQLKLIYPQENHIFYV